MLKQGLVALGAVALIGCGGGDPLSEGDAQLAWEATNSSINSGGSPGALSFSSNCADGGSVKFKYSLGDAFSGLGGAGADLEYELKFKGCKHNGVKITGDLTYRINAATSATSANVSWDWEGKLKYSGDIKGSCEYDIHGEVSAGAGTASVSYMGSICGHDASASLTADGTGVSNNVDGAPLDTI